MGSPVQYVNAGEGAWGFRGAGWYFWDETWSYCHGPYLTREEAARQLRRYACWLDGQEYQPVRKPEPWYVERMTAEEFLLGMLSLGTPLEISLVGVFEDNTSPGRASRRNVDLPLHRDGVYSESLARVQGGHYVEKPDIHYVGLYCLREGEEPCLTTFGHDDSAETAAVDLKQGQALIFDNTKLFHGRRGPVGQRTLIRVWLAAKDPCHVDATAHPHGR